MFMVGGGARGERTYGETDETGWNPVADPVHANDFHATARRLTRSRDVGDSGGGDFPPFLNP